MKGDRLNKKMSLAVVGAALLIFELTPSLALSAQSAFRPKATGSFEIIKGVDGLPYCYAQDLGVVFLCEPQWGVRIIGKDIIVIISETPAVTLTISQLSSQYRFLEQLSVEELKRLELYQEGFSTEPVVLDAKKALKIKALARENAQRRLADYFVILRGRLYGFLFSVQPKEDWEEYQLIIDRIVKSIRFIST